MRNTFMKKQAASAIAALVAKMTYDNLSKYHWFITNRSSE
jgi:hypothetical protein